MTELVTSFSPAETAVHPALAFSMRTGQSLSTLILSTRADRLMVAHLREQADFKSEYLIDPDLAALEDRKDEQGLVMALLYGHEPIATIRFIPLGQGLTLTERFWSDLVSDSAIMGIESWEVGRLVVAPEYRSVDLLTTFLGLSLRKLVLHQPVQHLHCSCLMRMVRLYRRFGFHLHAQRSKSGLDCALLHAPVAAAIQALNLDTIASTSTPGGLPKNPLLQ